MNYDQLFLWCLLFASILLCSPKNKTLYGILLCLQRDLLSLSEDYFQGCCASKIDTSPKNDFAQEPAHAVPSDLKERVFVEMFLTKTVELGRCWVLRCVFLCCDFYPSCVRDFSCIICTLFVYISYPFITLVRKDIFFIYSNYRYIKRKEMNQENSGICSHLDIG